MRGVCCAIATLAALAAARPLVHHHHHETLLDLERDFVSVSDIPLPKFLRLAKLTQFRDLEQDILENKVGGAAVKDTVYEKDMHRMIFLHAINKDIPEGHQRLRYVLENNMPRPSTGKTADEEAQRMDGRETYRQFFTKVFDDQSNTLTRGSSESESGAPDEIDRFKGMAAKLPPLLVTGEAMDQYLDLVKSCPLSPTSSSHWERAQEGVSASELAEAAGKRLAAEAPESINLVQSFVDLAFNWFPGDGSPSTAPKGPEESEASAVKGEEPTETKPGADVTVKACHFVRPYLEERGLFSKENWAKAKELWDTANTDAMDFEAFKGVIGKYFEKDSVSELAMAVAFRAAALSAYFDPNGAPIAPNNKDNDALVLDPCEFQLALTSLMRSRGWEEPLSTYLGEKPTLTFQDAQKWAKIVDMGNFATRGGEVDLERLLGGDAAAASDVDNALWDAVAGADKKEVSKDEIARFLSKMCDSADGSEAMASELLRDYDRHNAGQWDKQAFQAALSQFPVLVHGLSNKEITAALCPDKPKQCTFEKTDWLRDLESVVTFGRQAKRTKDGPVVFVNNEKKSFVEYVKGTVTGVRNEAASATNTGMEEALGNVKEITRLKAHHPPGKDHKAALHTGDREKQHTGETDPEATATAPGLCSTSSESGEVTEIMIEKWEHGLTPSFGTKSESAPLKLLASSPEGQLPEEWSNVDAKGTLEREFQDDTGAVVTLTEYGKAPESLRKLSPETVEAYTAVYVPTPKKSTLEEEVAETEEADPAWYLAIKAKDHMYCFLTKLAEDYSEESKYSENCVNAPKESDVEVGTKLTSLKWTWSWTPKGTNGGEPGEDIEDGIALTPCSLPTTETESTENPGRE